MKTCSLLLFSLILISCSTAYYGAMEKVGFHKRDILISRVKKAKKSQEDAKEVFQSALEEFIAVTEYKGGELEARYKKVDAAYKKSEARAAAVRSRNDEVENVSKALFKEWRKEIKLYENAEFRADSQKQYSVAEKRAEELLVAMRRAESRLNPVLRQFRDHVLYLKHNLNSRAISSLEGQVKRTQVDVSRLIKEMNASIAEADVFIKSMK